MQTELAFCQQIIQEAGQLLRDRMHDNRLVRQKSSSFDLVTEVDGMVQQMLVGRLREQFPAHGIVAEEADTEHSSGELTWYIDPLDGTTNYWHRVPFFSVSMALCSSDGLELGVVYAPALDELYWATRGGGAFNRSGPLHVSSIDKIGHALVVTGFPYKREPGSDNNLTEFNRVVPHVQAIRRYGSAALDLAWVASGRFDGFWELYLKPWDSLAGQLLVTEAGGIVSTVREGQEMHGAGGILAANPHLHAPLRRLLVGAE
jgi:myo-inositol-1(or 4)-monophosphatase